MLYLMRIQVSVATVLALCAARVRRALAAPRDGSAAPTGQSLVEYALIIALIAVVAMIAMQAFGTGISGLFTRLLERISGAIS